MFNLIPQFIHNEFKKGEYKGDCEVITMFMDISGFTAMTERLMNEGKEGAEVLSSILNGVFEPVIDAVYNRGGFISTFAGDAFTAIFSKDIEPVKTLYSAGEINNIFKEKGIQRTRFGDFDLSVKIGLSYGNVEWGIIGDSEYKAYFFKGEAVEGAALSEQKCDKMQIITDDKLLSLIPKNQQHIFNTIKHNEQYYRINEINMSLEKDTEPVSEKGNMSVDLDRDIVKLFMPDNVINYSGIGELRDIVSVFISLNEELHNYEDLNTFVKNTLEELNNIGGYFKGFDFGDKGGTLLAIFGAPVSYENNIIRALNFILTVKEIYGDKIKAGISYGTVYTGIVGSKRRYNYDVLGDIVNLSSRLMSNAGWGNIWLSKKMGEKQTEEFQIKPVGKISIKGKTDEEMVYELLGKKDKKSEKSYKGEMVGREEESKILNEYLKPVFNNKFGGMIYIYGEAGIGKSRFVYENIKSYEGQINHCILQTDNMLRKSMNPFVYYLSGYFHQSDNLSTEDKKKTFDKMYTQFINQLELIDDNKVNRIIEELKRTKTFIMALVGIEPEDKFYRELEPKLRFENTLYAVKAFFQGMSLIKPTIIQIEDIQWIDEDSKRLIDTLTRNVQNFPFIIIATSRLNDDGSKPFIKLSNEVEQKELMLKELSRDSIAAIFRNWLGKDADENLLSFLITRVANNPFYMEQFCLYLIENNIIEENKDKYTLKENLDGIPTGINSILIARIDRLSTELKETVQIASTLGREFDINILSKIFNMIALQIKSSEQSISDMFNTRAVQSLENSEELQRLLNEGNAINLWEMLSNIKYIFKHTLLYKTAYEMQLRKKLRKLHRIAGETIETLYGDNKEYYYDIAYHYDNAEMIEKAKQYLEKAGDYSRMNYENEKAIQIYDRLLELCEDDTEKKLSVIKDKVDILNIVSRWDDALEILNEGLNLARQIEDKTSESMMKNDIGNIYYKKSDYDRAMKLFEEAKEMTENLNETKLYARILNRMGLVYTDKGDFDKALESYEEVKEIFTKTDDRKGKSEVFTNLGLVYWRKSEYDKAMEYYNKAISLSEELNEKPRISVIVGNMGIVYRNRGEYDKAMECYQKKKEISEELGDKSGLSKAMGSIGTIYHSRGKYDEAMKYYKNSEHISRELGDKVSISLMLGNMGEIYKEKGEYDRAMKAYEEAQQIFKELGYKAGISIIRHNIGMIYSEKEEYEKALECYDEAIKIGKELGIKYYICEYLNNKAKLLYKYNKKEEAEKLNEEALELGAALKRGDIIYSAMLFKNVMKAESGDNKGIANLKAMLDEYKSDEQQAYIYYELWRLTSENDYKEKAKSLFHNLYDNTPKYEYKKKLEKMD